MSEPRKAVCFDLGGVVVRISYRWAEMLARAGLPVPDHVGAEDGLATMPGFEAFQAGAIDFDAYRAGMARHLSLSADQAERVHRSMLIEPFPGVAELVRELGERGFVTGCLSNTNAPHWAEMTGTDRFPAIRGMEVRLASHEIRAAKPSPEAFRAFAEACGTDQVLLFDDSAENCAAAIALGWQATRIDPDRDPARQMRSRLGLEMRATGAA